MKIYDRKIIPDQWFCQWNYGCILFALINSGMIDANVFKWLKPNEDMKSKSTEEKLLFELKVITVWALITGYYPFKHKETFYTIYTNFSKLVKEEKPKLDPETYNKKLSFFKTKIRQLEDLFVVYDEKSISNGTWDAGKYLRFEVEDFNGIEDLPCKSLICEDGKHWVVYIGTDGNDSILVVDSRVADGFVRIPIEKLKDWKIIKPKNIQIDSKRLEFMLNEFEANPKEMLHNLRKQEFANKITQLIARVEMINFTEHDYNRYVKQSQDFLDKLGKEHYKDEL